MLSGDLAASRRRRPRWRRCRPPPRRWCSQSPSPRIKRCRAALNKLDELARGFGRIDRASRTWRRQGRPDQRENRRAAAPQQRAAGSQPHITSASLTSARGAAAPHQGEYRKLPAEQRRSVDLNKLGDALSRRGLAAEAKATYVEAAGATADRRPGRRPLQRILRRSGTASLGRRPAAVPKPRRWTALPRFRCTTIRRSASSVAGGFRAAFLCRDPHIEQDVVVKACTRPTWTAVSRTCSPRRKCCSS